MFWIIHRKRIFGTARWAGSAGPGRGRSRCTQWLDSWDKKNQEIVPQTYRMMMMWTYSNLQAVLTTDTLIQTPLSRLSTLPRLMVD